MEECVLRRYNAFTLQTAFTYRQTKETELSVKHDRASSIWEVGSRLLGPACKVEPMDKTKEN